MKRICVFCGSSPGARDEYVDTARALGTALATQGLGLVYGGGRVGLMAVVADAALEHGGEVIGVIPQALADKEVAHQGLTELHVTTSMHERKALMADRSDGFVALPGGLGTLEELFEVLTWAQLGFHDKPCGLLNAGGYFDPLIQFLDHVVAERFLKPEHRAMLLVADTPGDMLAALAAYRATPSDKWLDREQL